MSETVTIEIDSKHALVRHIEDLQRALTTRNAQIERLNERLEAGEGSPLVEEAHAKGYAAGWKACAGAMMEIADKGARALREIRKESWDIYHGEGM